VRSFNYRTAERRQLFKFTVLALIELTLYHRCATIQNGRTGLSTSI